jgi:hypothetical protein
VLQDCSCAARAPDSARCALACAHGTPAACRCRTRRCRCRLHLPLPLPAALARCAAAPRPAAPAQVARAARSALPLRCLCTCPSPPPSLLHTPRPLCPSSSLLEAPPATSSGVAHPAVPLARASRQPPRTLRRPRRRPSSPASHLTLGPLSSPPAHVHRAALAHSPSLPHASIWRSRYSAALGALAPLALASRLVCDRTVASLSSCAPLGPVRRSCRPQLGIAADAPGSSVLVNRAGVASIALQLSISAKHGHPHTGALVLAATSKGLDRCLS